MFQDQWQQIAELFEEAMAQPAELRGSYLKAASRGDEKVRVEVEQMLHQQQRAEFADFLIPAPLFEVEVEPDPDFSATNQKFGSYQFVREIGRGGAGTVYLAVRADDAYQKQVAIKVITPSIGGTELLARFKQERQILAVLDHPNIARLLDGGKTENGWPYLVMEYVDGIAITEYCEAHQLSVKERLRLFCTVCEAVQYAHQNLIVHRDIKPRNILVTSEGQVKLLDFGIAKLLDHSLFDETSTLTQSNLQPMSPSYASPEQVRGDTLTTATDIWSLGILLYELLAGCRPFVSPNNSLPDVLRRICEEDPLPPGKAITQNQSPRIDSDLDNITLMALHKEPPLRYRSALQLSDDINRYLAGKPIIARPNTLWYRTNKYVRRNLVSVSLAAFSILLLLSGLMYAIWQTHVARQIAEHQRRQLYAAEIQKTMTDWEAGKIAGAQQRLERLIPAPGTADWRGFEWYYLQNLTQQEDWKTQEAEWIHGSALSPDGQLIANGSRRQIRIRDAQTGKEIMSWAAHESRIISLAFSFDHRFLLSSDQQGFVKLWDVATQRELLRLDDGVRIKAMSAVFSTDGTSFAYTIGNVAVVRENQTGRLLHRIIDDKIINILTFSPDGKTFVTGNYNKLVRAWDSKTWQLRFAISLPDYAEAIVFSPDGKILACGGIDNVIHLLDAHTGKEIRKISGHRDFILSMAFSPDAKLLASIGRERILRVHQVANGKELVTWHAHDTESWRVAFFPDGQRLLTTDNTEIKSWSLAKLQASQLWQGECHQCQLRALEWTPNTNQLVAGGYAGQLQIFDAQNRKPLQTLTKKDPSGILSLAVSPTGDWLVSTDFGEKVRLWDLRIGKEIATLKPPATVTYNPLFAVVVSPDGQTFATGGLDGKINLWDVTSQQVRQNLTGHPGGVYTLAFAADGRTLISGGAEGQAILWDLASGQPLQKFKSHTNTIQKVTFSPNGKLLATASLDATVKIWELATGREIVTLTEHADEVFALAFTPDGRHLATGSKDATIRIWDTETWQELLTLRGHASQVWALAFSADGKTLASASQDKTIRLWRSE